MSVSNLIENFVLFFKKKISMSEDKAPWFEMLQWKSLEGEIIRKICDTLEKNKDMSTYHDFALFNNHVKNTIDINNNILTESNKMSLQYSNGISDNGKKVIINYISIINDDYKLQKDNISIARLYLIKLMIPIFENWRTTPNSYNPDVYEICKLLNKYPINYTQGIVINDLYNRITNALYRIEETNDNVIYDIIEYVEKLNKKLEPVKEKIKVEHKVESKRNSSINIGDIDIKKLTKEGIVEICKKYNIDTKDCKLKNDYITCFLKHTKMEDKIEVLVEEKIPTKEKRKPLPSAVRTAVWNKYIGSSKGEAKCVIGCGTTISLSTFHCGHVKSKAKGGDDKIDNLRPICANCNTSMGTMNLNEFIKKYGFTS
jgi:5-methylcytosine-specific restriction endonuclease McrA